MNGLVGAANTIRYRQGHADGIRDALKVVRDITRLDSKNWVSGSLNWHQGVSNVLNELTRMLEDDTSIIEKTRGRQFSCERNILPPDTGKGE